MQIAILAFERLTLLDAVGPYEVLSKLPGAEVRWVGLSPADVRADGGLCLGIDATLEQVSAADVLLVPGGFGVRALLSDRRVLDWLRQIHETTRFTASVCTGSLLLAAAGLLAGVDATTHWARREQLAALGVNVLAERVVERGKLITAAGVSSGIDMALTLAARLAGNETAQAIQLALEYDPKPPFDAGSPDRADAGVRARVLAGLNAANPSLLGDG